MRDESFRNLIRDFKISCSYHVSEISCVHSKWCKHGRSDYAIQ